MHTGSFPHHEDRITEEGRRRLERLLVHEYAANAKVEQLSVNLGHRAARWGARRHGASGMRWRKAS